MSDYPKDGEKAATLRTYFMRGLSFIIPIAVTIWFVRFAVDLAENWLGGGVRSIGQLLLPSFLFSGEYPRLLEVITGLLSVVSLCVILLGLGVVASFRIGNRGLRLVDHVFIYIPGVNSVYRSVRKMVESFGDGNAVSFQRCVFLRFPAQHWTLGFVTKEVQEERTGRKILAVFVPTGPNPTGGFTQFVPEEETIAAPYLPEDGLKLVVSMGVLSPDQLPQLKLK